MTSTPELQVFQDYLKSLEARELSAACEAILTEFRRREAERIETDALRKLIEMKN